MRGDVARRLASAATCAASTGSSAIRRKMVVNYFLRNCQLVHIDSMSVELEFKILESFSRSSMGKRPSRKQKRKQWNTIHFVRSTIRVCFSSLKLFAYSDTREQNLASFQPMFESTCCELLCNRFRFRSVWAPETEERIEKISYMDPFRGVQSALTMKLSRV